MNKKYDKLFYLKGISGVYQLNINNETYIGSSIDIFNRLIFHGVTLRRNKHENKKLQLAYNEHRKIQYRILKVCEVGLLSSTEQFYVNKYKPVLNNRNKIAQSGIEYKYSCKMFNLI
jgi:hypothetical protein